MAEASSDPQFTSPSLSVSIPDVPSVSSLQAMESGGPRSTEVPSSPSGSTCEKPPVLNPCDISVDFASKLQLSESIVARLKYHIEKQKRSSKPLDAYCHKRSTSESGPLPPASPPHLRSTAEVHASSSSPSSIVVPNADLSRSNSPTNPSSPLPLSSPSLSEVSSAVAVPQIEGTEMTLTRILSSVPQVDVSHSPPAFL